MRRRYKWDKQYLHWGVTAFCVIAAAIVFFFLLRWLPQLKTTLSKLISILAPFIWGLVLSYLLSPLMNTLDTKVFLPLAKVFSRKPGRKGGKKFARTMAVIFSEIFLVLVLVAMVYLIIPQVLSSLQTLVSNSDTYMANLSTWIERVFDKYPMLEKYLGDTIGSVNDDFGNWLQTTLAPLLGKVIGSVTSGVYGFARGLYNLIIGIIVSIYLLGDREGYRAAVKRISYSVFSLETAENLRNVLRFLDKTFMSFITGKLLDSLIIGIICYICCSLMEMPYTLLISVIVGVTNIIPFFGPFFGAIPSALIILMVNPGKCLVFIIFIIILQQVDGNIIGPRILGSSTGITGFWVMFSIILGGGLFGFWGLLLGVPVFVVIYSLLTSRIERRLRKKDLPWEIKDFEELDYIDPATRQVVKKASVRREEIAREKAARREDAASLEEEDFIGEAGTFDEIESGENSEAVSLSEDRPDPDASSLRSL